MKEQEATRRLDTLEYLDQETVRVYDEAVARLDDPQTAERLREFRRDHERHVGEFADLAGRIEWSRGGPSQQFRQFMDEHLRVVQQASGRDRILEGLLLVERANLVELRRALEADLPGEAQETVRRSFEDEQRHVSYVEEQMASAVGLAGAARDARHGREGGGGFY